MTTPEQPTAKELRQMEVDAYDANIAIYQALLANLDGNWDADLIHLKDLAPQEAARQCPMDRIDRFAELQQYEQFSHLLKTETIERSKAAAILAIL